MHWWRMYASSIKSAMMHASLVRLGAAYNLGKPHTSSVLLGMCDMLPLL
jgi:hypothetical protein